MTDETEGAPGSDGSYGDPPRPSSWLAVDISEDWSAFFRLTTRGGEFEVAEVRVLPGRAERYRERVEAGENPGSAIEPIPRGGLPSNLMRKVRPDAARREAVAVWRTLLTKHGDDATKAMMARLGISFELVGTQDIRKHPGRRGRSDLFYANVAAIQAGFIKMGSRRYNVDTAIELSERLGEDVTPEMVRDWMHSARVKRIARPERSGGLTPQGRRLLAEEVSDDGVGD